MLSEAGQELGVNGYMLSEVKDEPTWPWRDALRMWKEAQARICIDANRKGGKNERNHDDKKLSEGSKGTGKNRKRKRTVRFVSRQVRTENPREGVEVNTVRVVFEACERIENTVLTEIGFRFLHFGYSKRTVALKRAYLIGLSGFQGYTCASERGEYSSHMYF
jgi:hypothetical protein